MGELLVTCVRSRVGLSWRPVALLMLVALSGCVRPSIPFLTLPDRPIVWPAPPDVPRVRMLDILEGSEDVTEKRSSAKFWDELLYGPAPPDLLVSPHAVAVDADCNRFAVADTNGACVHLFDLRARAYERKAACGSPPRHFECPVAVAWVGSSLWVADAKLHAVAIVESGGPGRWIAEDLLQRPAGLAYSEEKHRCYVSDAAAHCVLALDSGGKLLFKFGSRGAGLGQLNYPGQLACNRDGTVVVADMLNFRIQRFDLEGRPVGEFGKKGDAPGDLALPKGVAVDPECNIWVVDAHFENVQAFTPEGKLLMAFGKGGQEPGEFSVPAGAFIDGKRRLWIADTYNHRVQVFELAGRDGGFASPEAGSGEKGEAR
jgi:DNA-binding beta-propeller fold protein YncE